MTQSNNLENSPADAPPADEESVEAKRIVDAYGHRVAAAQGDRYSYFCADVLCTAQRREQLTIRALKRAGIAGLRTLKILDVGCGYGTWLRQTLQWGTRPENLFGVDLIADRINAAKNLCPSAISFVLGDATRLPWPDGEFDILNQATVFTSILDPQMKQAMAREMLRVTRAGGTILWFDFRFNNPRNPDVRGVGRREIRQLFPGCKIRLWPVCLAPPLARALAAWAPPLVEILNRVPVLCSHYLGAIQKSPGP